MKGIELVSTSSSLLSYWRNKAREYRVPIGKGEGYIPLFCDCLSKEDCLVFYKAFLCCAREEKGFFLTKNLRFPYGCSKDSFPFLRGALLEDLPEDDLSLLAELGITLLIDLRFPSKDEELRKRLARKGIAYRSCCLKPDWVSPKEGGLHAKEGMDSTYEGYASLLKQKDILDAVLDLMKKRNGKILVACSYGRDRTGLVSALLERGLGWDKRRILVDYSLSYFCLSSFLKGVNHKNINEHYDLLISPSRLWGMLLNDERF